MEHQIQSANQKLQFSSPKEIKIKQDRNREQSRRFRNKLKSDKDRFLAYKKEEAKRAKIRRQLFTPEQRAVIREQTRKRQIAYRAHLKAKAAQAVKVTPAKPLTHADQKKVDEKRLRNRLAQQKRRANMSLQKRHQEREKNHLRYYYSKQQSSKNRVYCRVLTPEEENTVVTWLQESASRGLRRSKDEILDTVQATLKGKEENNRLDSIWLAGFFRRHKELSFHRPVVSEANKIQRATDTNTKLQNWYKNVFGEISTADSDLLEDPERLFTCDNLSFELGGDTSWAPEAYNGMVKKSNSLNDIVTVLACGSASGEFLAPLLTFPGGEFNFKPMAGFPGAHFSVSDKGLMNEDIMRNWLKAAFIPAVKSIKKPVVLFIDREKCFPSLNLSELCSEHQIIPIQLPYSCHKWPIVHPLDLVSFRDLKSAWREEVLLYQNETADILGRKDFSKVFKMVWERVLLLHNNPLVKGFKNAGIYPWDPDLVNATLLRKSTGLTGENNILDVSVAKKEFDSCEEETATEDCPGMTSMEPQVTITNTPRTTEDSLFISFSEDISSHQSYSLHSIDPSSLSLVQPTNYPSDLPMARSVDLPPLTMLDRLLELSAKAGMDKLIHYRTIDELNWKRHNLDPEEEYFIYLHRKLKGILSECENKQFKHVERETTDICCPSSQSSPKKRKLFMEPEETVGSESVNNRLSCADIEILEENM